MKRLLVLFAVLVSLSWFIAGCGGTGDSSRRRPRNDRVYTRKGASMQEAMQREKAK